MPLRELALLPTQVHSLFQVIVHVDPITGRRWVDTATMSPADYVALENVPGRHENVPSTESVLRGASQQSQAARPLKSSPTPVEKKEAAVMELIPSAEPPISQADLFPIAPMNKDALRDVLKALLRKKRIRVVKIPRDGRKSALGYLQVLKRL